MHDSGHNNLSDITASYVPANSQGFCLGFDQSMKEMAFLLWRVKVFTVKSLGFFI